MKNKFFYILIILCSTFFLNNKLFSEEIEFDAEKIDVKKNGNLIIAYNSDTTISDKNITVSSGKVSYDKSNNKIIFKDDVIFLDNSNGLTVESDEIIYEKVKDIIYSSKETNFTSNNSYKIKSSNVYHDRRQQIIYGKEKTTIKDNKGNIFNLLSKFNFSLQDEIIKSKKAFILDIKNNKYFFEDLIVNLKTNEIIGKELKVNFNKSHFGNNKNDPILKGRSTYSNDEKLDVYKAVFSTCNTENKKCRGWELITDEFKHDKIKKIFEYKNSWLKIFDYKVFYLPYFNHPDPSVKRKSGFLAPSYTSSDSLGTSINFPYFKTFDNDKDITFSPRYYADKSFLLQNEYRQALQNSNILTDFSFLVGDAGTKGHLFYNQIGEFSKTKFEINLQDVRGDNYLKSHKLMETSSLIENDSLLVSSLNLNWNFIDSSLDTSFKIFEDLSRGNNDRYQYIFPDFNFNKIIKLPDEYNGNFNFNTYGYNKLYDTNVLESVLINDFNFASNEYIGSNGIVTNYNLLLKNSNNYSDNSTTFDENLNYNLFGIMKVDTSLPMQKKMDEYTHYLKPVLSFRYSPNGNSDLSSKDLFLNYNSAFDINRIGSSSQVEGGESMTVGLEFKRDNNVGFNIIDFKAANVLKHNEDYKMPAKSKLDKKRSDIFGNLRYALNENLGLNYFFSYDKDLNYSNLDQFGLDWNVNNFFTNISYYSEKNDLPEVESVKNNSEILINDENKFKFEVSKDLKDNFTEYYDLIYSYETDCIAFYFNFNKSFYRDGSLEPSKNLSFLLKIIPFTDLVVPKVGSLVGN